MSRATFTIAYDGPALHNGTMNVRDLAPALMALGQLFDAANSNLNGPSSQVNIEIRAHNTGSFEILFDLVQTFRQQMVGLFSSPEASAAANFLQIVLGAGTAGGGLVWLIQKLRGRPINAVEPESKGQVKITVDSEVYIIPLELLSLYQDLAVRTAMQRVVEEPLKRDGIDVFEARDKDTVVVRVEKHEAPYFSRPSLPDEVLIDETRRAAFSIISLAFKEDNKWRLFDGNTQISAGIEDPDFLARVDANQVSFSKGDILICDVRVKQVRTTDGLKMEYVVEKVIEHRPAARQLPLFPPASGRAASQ